MFCVVVLWLTLIPLVYGYQKGTGPGRVDFKILSKKSISQSTYLISIFSDGCCNTYYVTSTCKACYFWVVYGNAEMLDQTYERVDDLSNVIPLVNGSSSNIDYVIETGR